MKKVIYLFAAAMLCSMVASAQLLPSFQFGAKAGVNLSNFSTHNTLSSDSRAGFLGGFWARVGAAGLQFQPELYYTSKNVDLKSTTGAVNSASFKSIDLPLLLGTRVGALGIGARFNTGPLVSFAIDKDQGTGTAFSNATHLNYKDQNYAWQFGVGLDVQKISFDLRYELGLSKVSNNYGDKTRINMFNLTLGYRLFSL